jgi:hypothetical protein
MKIIKYLTFFLCFSKNFVDEFIQLTHRFVKPVMQCYGEESAQTTELLQDFYLDVIKMR